MDSRSLINQLTADLKPVYPVKSALRSAFIFFFILCGLAALSVLLMPMRSDFAQKIFEPEFLFQGAWLIVTSFLSTVAVVNLGRPGLAAQGRWSRSALGILLLLVLLNLGIIFFHFLRLGENPLDTDSGEHSGYLCLLKVLGLSLVPFALFFWQCRNNASTKPGFSGCLIGLASGTLAAAVLSFSCHRDSPVHFLAWHLITPLVILSSLGFFLGKRFLRW